MLKIISFTIAIYLIACMFLYVKQRALLYFPTAESHTSQAEAWWLDSEQHRLKLWKLNEGGSAIIYFGGNAEAVENNIGDFRHMFAGSTVYLVNYRGYGGSDGMPSEQALFADAVNVYDAISAKHSSINVIGRSLGSGVACHLAARRAVEKLALITPYDSMENLAQTHYPLFPVKWLIKDRFDSLQQAPSISSKTLVLIAEGDAVVPNKHSLELVNALQHVEAELVKIPAVQHNTISENPLYQTRLQAFLRQNGQLEQPIKVAE